MFGPGAPASVGTYGGGGEGPAPSPQSDKPPSSLNYAKKTVSHRPLDFFFFLSLCCCPLPAPLVHSLDITALIEGLAISSSD